MDTMELRLVALAKRGFAISFDVRSESFGQHAGRVRFAVRLTKGDAYRGSGMTANGEGYSLDDATHAALRAAEGFLGDADQPAAVEAALGDMAKVPLLQAAE